jgi:3-hydroxyisobutyrate dehydrogenase-like beta-hydroxyacid dehydrogenase
VADAVSTEQKAAFLGLGIMGAPMAANLARGGIEVVAWNRTPEKAEALAAEHDNVSVAGSPEEAAAAAGIVITMVPDAPQVEEVLLGQDGAAAGLGDTGLAIDMSTISPAASRGIGERLAERGVAFLDAPVTGSRPKAEDGTLTIMVGGAEEAYERALPLFQAMGKLVLHMGPQGHGSTVKLINNTLAAVNAAALAEGITLARQAGLDLDKAMQVVASGSGNSAMRELKSGPMIEGSYDPLFKLEHMLKDVRYFLAESREMGVDTGVAGTAAGLYEEADSEGYGESDFAAVIEAIVTKSGLK